jgi:hypothetical protein
MQRQSPVVAMFCLLGLACGSSGKLKNVRGIDPALPADAASADAAGSETPPVGDGGPGLQLPDGFSAPAVACTGNDTQPAPQDCAALGVSIAPAFLPEYTCFDLGPVPGLPAQKYGGLTLSQGPCSTTLLIGGAANTMQGKLYAIKVKRDPRGHITGFEGTAAAVADAPYNDGGITFGPSGVLFLARWPKNQLQQTLPGSAAADKVIDLAPFGVTFASGSLAFVPRGFPGAGLFKVVSWPGGNWYTVTLAADGKGLHDVKKVSTVDTQSPGGPEGFVYVAPGSPKFDVPAMLVSEWDAKRVSSYAVDTLGEPQLTTRRDFVVGLSGAEGAYRDPGTGDFFFSTFTALGQNLDRVVVVRGFLPSID